VPTGGIENHKQVLIVSISQPDSVANTSAASQRANNNDIAAKTTKPEASQALAGAAKTPTNKVPANAPVTNTPTAPAVQAAATSAPATSTEATQNKQPAAPAIATEPSTSHKPHAQD